MAILVLLAACTPQVQAYNDPPGETGRLTNDTFYAGDGVALPLRNWLPKGRPTAVILAVHGFNDYSNAFDGTGKYFSAHHVAVYAYDQRGFGKAPQTGIWAGESNLVSDVKQCIELLSRRYPGRPIYLMGESMGGGEVIVAAASRDFPKVSGVILVAPAVWGENTMPLFFRGTLWLGAHVIPFEKFTGSDLKILACNNIPLLRRMYYDPLVIKATRVDAIYGIVRLMDSAYDKVPDVHTRVLLLYGGKDQVIPPEPIKLAAKRFTAPLTYAYYPAGYHMLLRDLEGQSVMDDILHWIRYPAKPLPSGADAAHSAPGKEPVGLQASN